MSFACVYHQMGAQGEVFPDPANLLNLLDRVSWSAVFDYLPHAPGVRMMVLTLTPSNDKDMRS